MHAFDLQDRVIIVTGAASGIGRASAARLAEAGATVVCADLNETGAADTARSIGDRAEAAALDVTDRASVETVVARAIEEHGRVDVMANIAGIPSLDSALDITEAELDTVLAVNLKGVLFGCQAAAPHMIERGSGSIINFSSGVIDSPGAHICSRTRRRRRPSPNSPGRWPPRWRGVASESTPSRPG